MSKLIGTSPAIVVGDGIAGLGPTTPTNAFWYDYMTRVSTPGWGTGSSGVAWFRENHIPTANEYTDGYSGIVDFDATAAGQINMVAGGSVLYVDPTALPLAFVTPISFTLTGAFQVASPDFGSHTGDLIVVGFGITPLPLLTPTPTSNYDSVFGSGSFISGIYAPNAYADAQWQSGVSSNQGYSANGSLTLDTVYGFRLNAASGSSVTTRVWDASVEEPSTWDATVSLPSGGFGTAGNYFAPIFTCASLKQVGTSTTALDNTFIKWDNLSMSPLT